MHDAAAHERPDDEMPPWRRPTRAQAAGFWLRSRLLAFRRCMADVRRPRVCRWEISGRLATAPIRAQWRTPLWMDNAPNEFLLTAGKVNNLRRAAKAFHGVEVPAGGTLSFWRQVGRPTARRGYVLGREIRAGCVVPTVAGGICQLANALASCATRAGFELLERHAHTVAMGSDAPLDQVDATIFWNYVDLRVRAPVSWRLELQLTADELILTIRAPDPAPEPRKRPVLLPARSSLSGNLPQSPVVRNCLSCGESTCFRHRPMWRGAQARCAWLLNDWTPEFEQWLRMQEPLADRLQPMPPGEVVARLLGRQFSPGRGSWSALPRVPDSSVTRFALTSLHTSWRLRRYAGEAGKRQAIVLDGQRRLAEAYIRRLRPEHTHLVVDQGLLPHLYLSGALGGRTYEVFVHTLPMDEIQRRLNAAASSSAMSARGIDTLHDFRAAAELIEGEMQAMLGARKVIAAHRDVAEHWRGRAGLNVQLVSWILPNEAYCPRTRASEKPPLVVFPASALARKGAYELAAALQGLGCRLRVLGSASHDVTLWQGLVVEHGSYSDDWLASADVVVLPAYVEHTPRPLLRALAAGVPIIATPASGIPPSPGINLVPAGDVNALRTALEGALRERQVTVGCQDGR